MSETDFGKGAVIPASSPPFWSLVPLEMMTADQWESLCDGCGWCCMEKLQDVRSGAVAYTNVACRLFDISTCRCRRYADRRKHVRSCQRLTAEAVRAFDWLPDTCAYRLVAAGRDLPSWHHLVSGDRDLVHRIGVSARGRAIPEHAAGALEHHLIERPGRRI